MMTIRDLKITLFTTEWGYRFGKWQPLIGYSQQRLNIDPNPLFPLSWERDRLTLGTQYHWEKGMKLVAELTLNDENTGGGSVNNDGFILFWIAEF